MADFTVSFSDPEIRRLLRAMRRDALVALDGVNGRIGGLEERLMLRIEELLRTAQDQSTVIGGLETMITEVVATMRRLASEQATPEQWNELASILESNTTRIGTAVTTGTSAENEVSPQVDPAPMGAEGLRRTREQGAIGERSVARGEDYPGAAKPGAYDPPPPRRSDHVRQAQDAHRERSRQADPAGQWPPREGFTDPGADRQGNQDPAATQPNAPDQGSVVQGDGAEGVVVPPAVGTGHRPAVSEPAKEARAGEQGVVGAKGRGGKRKG